MTVRLTPNDRMGLAHPAVDVHTLGIDVVAQLLADCGIASVIAPEAVCQALESPHDERSQATVAGWIRANRLTAWGFSYRLDPEDGARLFAAWRERLAEHRLLNEQGGPLRAIYFAGLPQACRLAGQAVPALSGVFCGDESLSESLRIFGIDPALLPGASTQGLAYDEDRLAFGRELVRKADYWSVRPVDRSRYAEYGTAADSLAARLQDGKRRGLPPLMRAHAGPYLPNRAEAVRLFLDWCRGLALSGFLDVLSIGTSQLTQSHFGEDWGSRPNGGGVPIASPEEFSAVWQAARPMLVRTYAGTRHVADLARMYEETIHIAWHALSLWWFCQIDGRGPYSVRENLEEHAAALRCVAASGKPFEANVAHHFAFRGADDVTYIVSAILAARFAKAMGIRHFVLQNMLNTPKNVWGIADLAKSRAMLRLARELEDARFHVILQPRGGLDSFSHDAEKAKAHLAAVTGLMDDIEPHDSSSPGIVHVVGYSEGSHLADPAVIDESIRIVRCALEEYRRLRRKGDIEDMARNAEVEARTEALVSEARTVLRAIEWSVPNPYTPGGLYRILAQGFLPVPHLAGCRGEFERAVAWQTRLVRGTVRVVDADGRPLSAAERMARTLERPPENACAHQATGR